MSLTTAGLVIALAALGGLAAFEREIELVWSMLIFGGLLAVLAPALGALAAALSNASRAPS